MIEAENQDFAAFETAAMGGAAETPVTTADDEPEGEQEAAPEAAPEVNDEAGEQPGDDDPQPKPKQSAQERINEVTRARREAERERDYWRGVAEGRTQPQSQQERQPEEAKAPDPADYDYGETDPAYIKDVIAHEVKRGVDEAARNMAQEASVQAEERAWEAKQSEARSKFADYDQKVIEGAEDWPCPPHMAVAIRTSDVGGELAYHLASNPEEARRIAALDPLSQVREIGRLEGRLSAPASEPKQPAKTTNAPKPPEAQARGAGGQFQAAADTTDFAAFEAMANRKG